MHNSLNKIKTGEKQKGNRKPKKEIRRKRWKTKGSSGLWNPHPVFVSSENSSMEGEEKNQTLRKGKSRDLERKINILFYKTRQDRPFSSSLIGMDRPVYNKKKIENETDYNDYLLALCYRTNKYYRK